MPSREYRDPSGVVWDVFEVHRLNNRKGAVRPALSEGWLAFVSAGQKRRLPQYPPDWLQLTDDELYELLSASFQAPDPLYPVPGRRGQLRSAPDGRDTPQPGDRRKRSREIPPSLPTGAAPAPPESQPTVTAVSAPPAAAGLGLPVPPPATVSGTLGAVRIETLVREHARQARIDGVAVIAGMIGVKRALAGAGEDVTPATLTLLRKVFVDEFYFGV